jgi:hypothetical protein
MINKFNYEAFALDYIEGNLSATDRQAMETFLQKYPTIAEDIIILSDIVTVVPDKSIVFDNKSALLKQEGGARVVAMHRRTWFRLAIATAAMFLLVGGYLSGYFTDNSEIKQEIVINPPENKVKEIAPIEKEEILVNRIIDKKQELNTPAKPKVQEKVIVNKSINLKQNKPRNYDEVANTVLPKADAIPEKKPVLKAPFFENNAPENKNESAVAIDATVPKMPEEVPQLLLTPEEKITTVPPIEEVVAANENPREEVRNENEIPEESKNKKALRKIGRFFGKLPFEGATASIIPTYYTDRKKDKK